MNFLSAVYARTWQEAWTNLNGTSMYEMLRLLDQIDRADLKEFLKLSGGMAFIVNLPRIVFAASVVEKRSIPPNSGSSVDSDIRDARNFLVGRSPLRITKDATRTLPAPIPNMGGLTEQDFESAAASLNVEPAAIRAVAWVESGGSTGFAADGRAIIRYELHVFNKRTQGKFTATHPQFSAGYQAGRAAHTRQDSQANEYGMLHGAMLMFGHRETALASASWGAFQIMGYNHRACGFATASAFAQSMSLSASNQLTAFLEFSRSVGAQNYLANRDWAAFASHYNGPDYRVNHYDTNLAAAYQRFSSGS
jgi:hypothetical protein